MTKYFLIKGRILSFLVTLFKPVSIHNYLKFQIIYKSKPLKYLPENKDFGNKIKIRLILLGKKRKRA